MNVGFGPLWVGMVGADNADNQVSIGDTLSLVGTLGDTDGVIRSYAWNFRGHGRFGPSYAVDLLRETFEAWPVYPDTGRFMVYKLSGLPRTVDSS